MSGYGFTEDSARRIVNAVRKVEGDTTPPVAVGPRFTGSQMSVVKVTSLGSPFATGQRVDYNASANTQADINQVKIKEVNGATLTVGNYYVGLFSGYTTTDDPLFLVNVSGSGGGGNAVIDVVTDVTCDPVNGLVVSTVTLSGADYDNAVIRNFLALSDVDAKSYVGNAGRVVQVNATADGLEFGDIVTGVSDSFISLTDTPPAYGSTNTYKVLTVSSTNAGISFSDNNITTKNSIKGGGNPNNPTTYASLELVGDVSTPVANYFYGADSSSVRGWYKVKFTSLDNVPNSFTGQAGKFLKVNTGATALEFAEVDIDTIQTDVTTLQTDLGTAQTNISTLQTDLGTAQTNISTLQTDITTLQTDLATAQTDIADILTRLSTAETAISTLQTDLATAQTDITTLQTDLATAQTDISTLQTDLATAQTDITNNYNSLDSRITALGG
jgi:hypothetical protein